MIQVPGLDHRMVPGAPIMIKAIKMSAVPTGRTLPMLTEVVLILCCANRNQLCESVLDLPLNLVQ
jgi:hypothetical protein